MHKTTEQIEAEKKEKEKEQKKKIVDKILAIQKISEVSEPNQMQKDTSNNSDNSDIKNNIKEKKFDLTDQRTLRDFLKLHKIWTKKKFGQNFLQCRESLENIVKLGELSKGETVVEVGPGHGVLTRELLQEGVTVNAVEIDPDVLPALSASTRQWKDNLTVDNCHVLDFTPPKGKYKFIANIPYHLTSPILRKFLIDTENKPTKLVMLVQKEVAEKIACKDDKNSLLSVMVKTFGKPSYAFTVTAEKFFPAPKVDSAVLVIDTFEKPLIDIPSKIYFEMLFAGFSSPRKKLKNALMKRLMLTKAQVDPVFEELHIDHDCRAQNVTIPQWEAMTKIFFKEYFINTNQS